MSIWVANGYPFSKEPHSEGVHDRLHYHRGTKNLEELLAESVGNKRGKMLVTGRKKQTRLNVVHAMAYQR